MHPSCIPHPGSDVPASPLDLGIQPELSLVSPAEHLSPRRASPRRCDPAVGEAAGRGRNLTFRAPELHRGVMETASWSSDPQWLQTDTGPGPLVIPSPHYLQLSLELKRHHPRDGSLGWRPAAEPS
ncbi:hypothetical protein DPEC_G00263960 [Dallia pectoralis]|uniref:Uncharacterized protein n=1 Tax=Dallia pectoralis TaxID=75939 RepID=A0ACC2FS93_DALPE|nr:hypothetical protein DPEC_G00263960 [Dallia pectoralis]